MIVHSFIDYCLFLFLCLYSINIPQYSSEIKNKKISMVHNKQFYNFNITNKIPFSHTSIICHMMKHNFHRDYTNMINISLNIVHHNRIGQNITKIFSIKQDLENERDITIYEFDNWNVKETEFNMTIYEGGMGFEGFLIEMKYQNAKTFISNIRILLAILILIEAIYTYISKKHIKNHKIYIINNLVLEIFLLSTFICEWSLIIMHPLLILTFFISMFSKFIASKIFSIFCLLLIISVKYAHLYVSSYEIQSYVLLVATLVSSFVMKQQNRYFYLIISLPSILIFSVCSLFFNDLLQETHLIHMIRLFMDFIPVHLFIQCLKLSSKQDK